eukprot:3224595-Rhodomonas_salina.2
MVLQPLWPQPGTGRACAGPAYGTEIACAEPAYGTQAAYADAVYGPEMSYDVPRTVLADSAFRTEVVVRGIGFYAVLRWPVWCRPTSGTERAYGAIGLRACYAMSGTEIASGHSTSSTHRTLPLGVRTARYAISLHACYAMSGTDLACAAVALRTCYAKPALRSRAGILRYQPTRVLQCEIKYKKPHFQYKLYQECVYLHLISGCISLRARDAVSGTDIACGATRVLCSVRN